MRFKLQACVLFAFIFSLFACSSGDTEEFRTVVFVNDLNVVSISIDVAENQDTLDVNDPEVQLVLPVIATLGDGSTTPVSRFLQWSSSDQGVISVNGSGIARPVATGEATITATLGDFSDSIVLEASDAPLVGITPSSSGTPLICSFDTTLSALGTYQNEGEDPDVRDISGRVDWSSSDTSIADVQDNDDGVPTILARKDGSVTLTASLGSESSIPPLSVTIAAGTLASIAITPLTVSHLEEEDSQLFVATGTYTNEDVRDITQASVWASSNEANLDPVPDTPGLFDALQEGSVTVTAACGGVTSAPASVTVIEPRTITGIEIRDSNGVRLDDILEKRPSSADFRLEAWLIYNNGDPVEIENDDEELDWRVTEGSSNVLTVDNTEGSKGFIDLLGNSGEVEIEVRYVIDTRRFTDTITIDVDVDN